MREALTLALNEFDGGVVLVSHDRHLMRTTVDEFLLVEAGCATAFEGDLEDYRKRLDIKRAAEPDADKTQRKLTREQAQQDRQAAQKQRRQISQEIVRLEKMLAQYEAEKTALDGKLCDAQFYADHPWEARQASIRQAELQGLIEATEAAWLMQQEALERLGS